MEGSNGFDVHIWWLMIGRMHFLTNGVYFKFNFGQAVILIARIDGWNTIFNPFEINNRLHEKEFKLYTVR